MPEELRNHPGTKFTTKVIDDLAGQATDDRNVVEPLGKVINRVVKEVAKTKEEKDRKLDMLTKAGDALAWSLRMLCDLFQEVPFFSPDDHDGILYKRLLLNEDVKDLSLDAMATSLRSDKLDLGEENEAYYLLGAWIYQCSHFEGDDKMGGSGDNDSNEKTRQAKRVEAFKQLAVHVRFEHLTLDFLANIVANCPLAIASGLISWMMHCSLVAYDTKWKAINTYKINLGREDRAYCDNTWEFKTHFSLEELLTLKEAGDVTELAKFVGVARGYPVAVKITRGGSEDTVGIHFYVAGLNFIGEGAADGPDQHAVFSVFLHPIRGQAEMYPLHDHAFTGTWHGSEDILGKSWAEVVFKKSPYCKGGKLAIKITFRTPAKEN